MAKAPKKRPRRGARQLVDVPRYASEHPDFTQCRVFAHPWTFGTQAIEYRNGQVVWNLTCSRCGATQELHTGRRSGEVEYRRYQLSEGYLWDGVGQQKPKKAELRVAMVATLMRRGGKR